MQERDRTQVVSRAGKVARLRVACLGYEITLLPATAYEVCYTPSSTVIGFAFDSQSGMHAFESDRVRSFRTKPNSLACIPAGCSVRSSSLLGGEYLTITSARAVATRHFNNVIDRRAIEAAQVLRRMLLTRSVPDVLQIETQVATFEALIGDGTAPARGAERWMTPRRLKQVDEYIEARLSGSLDVNGVARSIGLSSGFFNRAFRAAIGKTPHDYIVDRRIAAARRSIVDTDMHLADIAVACGFSSQAHMTTIFRKRLGITPALLRKH
ncbi:helix-turn-helix transcriptional regulator [Rhodomicrobium vannielii ATCC 17100]|uniref:helix-turn-helix transcriptional regulator n=1 Tax=Rhodomicrobium vannielii TaxID=1069 RepID=UPI00191861C1|nr:AraC family transcriptional regulator [Rhodomicrobium vannielii]MBJ7532614.1 helix-turn-helix transcriptional regulator [Rhodomicrobium vannielii ATCC 17100]